MKKDLLVYMNTYNRYDNTLPMAILSVINQTYKFDKLVIFDDNKEENARDLRQTEHYKYLFDMMDQKGIAWEYRWGQRKGAHFNHEDANMMGYKYAFFIDDDQILEPNTLEELMKEMNDGVGCVGGLILKPPAGNLPAGIDGTLADVYKGQNIAWYKWDGEPREVEHLYSSFLYRCGIVHHDLRLSKKVFRGETMFTHSFFLKGYKLIITPKAVTWHFEGAGGCRTPEEEKTNQEMYANDHAIFNKWLTIASKPIAILVGGLGDHIVFRKILDDLKIKDILVACTFPEVFEGFNIISIAEAEDRGYNKKDYDVYVWMNDRDWKGSLYNAYLKMYENTFAPRN